jgi:hypothetical protein
MAMSHVELYEALKRSISDQAARLIAEVVPAAKDLATVSYVDLKFAAVDQKFALVDQKFALVDQKFAELRGEMLEGFASIRAEIHREAKSTMRWMLGLFIPVWGATLGTLILALAKLH